MSNVELTARQMNKPSGQSRMVIILMFGYPETGPVSVAKLYCVNLGNRAGMELDTARYDSVIR